LPSGRPAAPSRRLRPMGPDRSIGVILDSEVPSFQAWQRAFNEAREGFVSVQAPLQETPRRACLRSGAAGQPRPDRDDAPAGARVIGDGASSSPGTSLRAGGDAPAGERRPASGERGAAGGECGLAGAGPRARCPPGEGLVHFVTAPFVRPTPSPAAPESSALRPEAGRPAWTPGGLPRIAAGRAGG
jgi:hypothetical protein